MPEAGPTTPTGRELAALGAGLAAAFLGPLFLGIAGDRLLGTSPLFLMVGLVVGIVAAVGLVYVRFRRYL